MQTPGDDDARNGTTSAKGSLFLLMFGLAVLAFLVAIERPHWFSIKPATGTARAMSFAAEGGARS